MITLWQIFGTIDDPLKKISPRAYPDIKGGGLAFFLTNIVRLLFIIGGLLAFFNLIIAGLQFINAGGDPKNIENAWNKIWQSIIGLIIIVTSFVIAAIGGWLFFGDATAILSPKVFGP